MSDTSVAVKPGCILESPGNSWKPQHWILLCISCIDIQWGHGKKYLSFPWELNLGSVPSRGVLCTELHPQLLLILFRFTSFSPPALLPLPLLFLFLPIFSSSSSFFLSTSSHTSFFLSTSFLSSLLFIFFPISFSSPSPLLPPFPLPALLFFPASFSSPLLPLFILLLFLFSSFVFWHHHISLRVALNFRSSGTIMPFSTVKLVELQSSPADLCLEIIVRWNPLGSLLTASDFWLSKGRGKGIMFVSSGGNTPYITVGELERLCGSQELCSSHRQKERH